MIFRLLADLVLALHAAFVLFAVAGGLLVLRRPRVAWLHVPAAAWAALVELAGWISRSRRWRTSCGSGAAGRATAATSSVTSYRRRSIRRR